MPFPWIEPFIPLILWAATASLLCFLISLVLIPWLIIRIPTDYFQPSQRQTLRTRSAHPKLDFLLAVAKNCAGIAFILAGIAMLLLPGQGLITILIGLMLTNFPGKFRLEQYIIRQKRILQAINWIRRHGKKPPLSISEPVSQ